MPPKKSRQNKIETESIPAPIGGLNSRDGIAIMKPSDALILDNFFPTPTDVVLRNGYNITATGLPGWVESILPYSGLTGARKLFGASGTAIYDVSSPGAVGAAVVTGLSNARFQWVNFGTAGNTYLYGVNGNDDPVLYNGTTWQQVGNATAPISITGVDPSTFIGVNIWQRRLYFVPVNDTKIWYLAPASVGGAALSIDFGPLLSLGGNIQGVFTWVIDNAQGIQEYLVVCSSEGEVLVYGGYDPTTEATFFLVAKFRMGRPIGRRFFCKNGSDVALLTMDGLVPLSQSLLTDRSKSSIAVSDKIRSSIQNDVNLYNTNFGWQVILFPQGNKIVVNVPVIENNIQYQYVTNTITGAWCTFGKLNSSWYAACFEAWEDGLYFGGNGYVSQCDIGTADGSDIIVGTAKTAFNYFKSRGQQKYFTMVRPLLLSKGTVQAAIDLNVNFEDRPPTSTPSHTDASGSPWDTSPWDTSPWDTPINVTADWDTPNAIGYCAAVYMKIATDNLGVSWESTDFAYEMGGVL